MRLVTPRRIELFPFFLAFIVVYAGYRVVRDAVRLVWLLAKLIWLGFRYLAVVSAKPSA